MKEYNSSETLLRPRQIISAACEDNRGKREASEWQLSIQRWRPGRGREQVMTSGGRERRTAIAPATRIKQRKDFVFSVIKASGSAISNLRVAEEEEEEAAQVWCPRRWVALPVSSEVP
ncbi:hypothetical protein E2C01_017767 [Portunus trituberculatus]|uniref:Uncharacterized protein n=1 Tax=Portunus trituberculatus TaxID=210409 RepID=A0A5B7DUG2_PORTR|nr:hypothetical protein [Portunus trituberculatus]